MGFLHILSSAIMMLILISLLILVHEAGHFFAAKSVGIRVDKFGFGLPFGPTLFSKKFGETEILIHAFLLGGYVSFPDDEEDCDLPKDSPLRYSNKTVAQRAWVISAGVICNIVFAYFLIFSTGFIWKQLPANNYTILFSKFAPTAVESIKNSGIKENDKIYSINGTKIIYPATLNMYFQLSKEFDGQVSQKIIDEKYTKLKKLNPNVKEEIPVGTTIKLPDFTDEEPVSLSFDNIIGIEKYQSEEIKLNDLQKDLRNKINYKKIYKTQENITLRDLALAISDTKKPISITVVRDNEQISLKTVYSNKDGVVGIEQKFIENYVETKNLKQLTSATVNYVNYNLNLMVYTLGKLFSGKVRMSEMNGIIAIAKIGTEIIAYKGLFYGLLLSAIISLNLALINILPIPALDGGHLFFLLIEQITGKPVSKKFVEGLNNFFFYLLIALMLLIVYNDVHAWIIGKI